MSKPDISSLDSSKFLLEITAIIEAEIMKLRVIRKIILFNILVIKHSFLSFP